MKTFVALIVLTATAFAEDHNPEAAKNDFEAALVAYNGGNIERACDLFARAYDEGGNLGALLSLAQCEQARNRPLVAWQRFRQLRDLAGASQGAGKVDPARYEIAVTAMASFAPTIRVTIPNAPREIHVTLAGDSFDLILSEDVPFHEGTFEMLITGPTIQTVKQQITVGHDHTRIELPPLTIVSLPPPPKPVVTTPYVDEPTGMSTQRKIAIGLASGGVAMFGIAAGFAVHARSIYKSSRGPGLCDDTNVCTPTGSSKVHDAVIAADTATWLTAGGVALVAAGAIVWLTVHPSERSSIALTPTRDGASALFTTRF